MCQSKSLAARGSEAGPDQLQETRWVFTVHLGFKTHPPRTVGSPHLCRSPGPPPRTPAFPCNRAHTWATAVRRGAAGTMEPEPSPRPSRARTKYPLCAWNLARDPKGTSGTKQEWSVSSSYSGKGCACAHLPLLDGPRGGFGGGQRQAPARGLGAGLLPGKTRTRLGAAPSGGRVREKPRGCSRGRFVTPG